MRTVYNNEVENFTTTLDMVPAFAHRPADVDCCPVGSICGDRCRGR